MIDEFIVENVVDNGDETSNMELTKDNLMAALDEFDFRSERPLPHEHKLFRKLIDEYFKQEENLGYVLGMYENLLSKYEILFNLLNNEPLKFEELEVGQWVWDNKTKKYKQISIIPNIINKTGHEVNFVYFRGHKNVMLFEEDRFYRREIKE